MQRAIFRCHSHTLLHHCTIMSFMALVPNVCCAGGIGQACTDEAIHQRTRGCKTFIFQKAHVYLHSFDTTSSPKPAGSQLPHYGPPCVGLHRRSCEERPGTCACAALREHELLVPFIAALAAPTWKRSATSAGRELSGRIEGRERRQALAKAKAALAAVDKATAMGKTLDRKDTFAEKASPHKKRLSDTGTRSTEWRASTWVA